MWSNRSVMRRPCPGKPRNVPGTVPLHWCSITQKSAVRGSQRLGADVSDELFVEGPGVALTMGGPLGNPTTLCSTSSAVQS